MDALSAQDPNAPKRGMTSFFLFSNDMRAKVKNEGGGLKASEIVTKLAEMWKVLCRIGGAHHQVYPLLRGRVRQKIHQD